MYRAHDLATAVAWAGLSAGACIGILFADGGPAPILVAGGAVVGFAAGRRTRAWPGLVAATIRRAADAGVLAAVTWHLALDHSDGAGAALGTAAVALGVLASYVGVRARSLGIDVSQERPAEHGARLLILAAGLASGQWTAGLAGVVTFDAARALVRGMRAWRLAEGRRV